MEPISFEFSPSSSTIRADSETATAISCICRTVAPAFSLPAAACSKVCWTLFKPVCIAVTDFSILISIFLIRDSVSAMAAFWWSVLSAAPATALATFWIKSSDWIILPFIFSALPETCTAAFWTLPSAWRICCITELNCLEIVPNSSVASVIISCDKLPCAAFSVTITIWLTEWRISLTSTNSIKTTNAKIAAIKSPKIWTNLSKLANWFSEVVTAFSKPSLQLFKSSWIEA